MRFARARPAADRAQSMARPGCLRWSWSFCWLLALTCWTTPVQAQAPVSVDTCTQAVPITQARRIVTRGTDTLADAVVTLPDPLPMEWRNEQIRLQYEVDVSACAGSLSAVISLYRVGAPYTIRIHDRDLTSVLAYRWFGHGVSPAAGTTGPQDVVHNGRIPALLALPQGADKAVITLLTLPYIPAGLMHLAIGPTNALLPVAADYVNSVVGFTTAAAGVMLVLALIAGLLWLQRRHDLGFLWMTLACLFWSLRALAYFDANVHMPPLWFEQFNPYNIFLTAITLCAATLDNEMQRRHDAPSPAGTDWRVWPHRALWFAFISTTLVLALSIWLDRAAMLARAYAQIWAAGLSLATIAWLWAGKVRLTSLQRIATIGAYMALIGSALHDMALVTGHLDPSGPSYLFWGFTLVLIVYALISGNYIIRTLNRAENVNLELEQRIHSKSTELEDSYLQLRKTEMAGALSSARLQERERLLRDMHDGLGAHLMTALRGVERSALNRDQIVQSLQDGIDELRMMMDSADMGADLSAALAAWRNRWDNRLGAAGVQVHWKLDDALDTIALDSDALLQIMRILQEAATNVVKHSGARHLQLQATRVTEPGQTSLLIVLSDDGCGLPAQATQPHQRGLRNMEHRAEQIGATLQTSGADRGGANPGCQIRFMLPIDPPPKRPERRKHARTATASDALN